MAEQAARRTPILAPSAARPEAAISIAPMVPAARFALRLPEAAAKAIGSAAGFRLDMAINRSAAGRDGRLAARLGPDEWLLHGPETASEAIARDVEAALAGRHFALVDIGHRNVAIAVAGAHARAVINGGCPLDLDDDAFPAGSATRTLLGKAEIVLLRTDEAPVFRIECWRSFAPYVLGLLEEVGREFAGA